VNAIGFGHPILVAQLKEARLLRTSAVTWWACSKWPKCDWVLGAARLRQSLPESVLWPC